MCIKREPHEILQPVSDLVQEFPRMIGALALVPRRVAVRPQTPQRATDGAFPGLNAYFATTENV